MILTLESHFNAAHLYFQPKWDAKTNTAKFGKCFSEHGHGHNYRVELDFEVSLNTLEQEQITLQKLTQEIAEELDHHHLNFVLEEFKHKIPTTENIGLYLCRRIQARPQGKKLKSLRLFEMDSLWTEITV